MCVFNPPKEEQRTLRNRFYCFPRYVGNHILLFGYKKSYFPFQCMVGPDWSCMLCTYTLIGGLSSLFLLVVTPQLHRAVTIIGAITTGTTLCCFSITACSDPGIVWQYVEGKDAVKQMEMGVTPHQTQCSQCDIMRPFSAHHCSDCNLCIDVLDHHCPWTGKCIGKRTIFFFQALYFGQ